MPALREAYTMWKERRTVYLLQRHAVAIRARLAASLVLAYALPAEVLKPLLARGRVST